MNRLIERAARTLAESHRLTAHTVDLLSVAQMQSDLAKLQKRLHTLVDGTSIAIPKAPAGSAIA